MYCRIMRSYQTTAFLYNFKSWSKKIIVYFKIKKNRSPLGTLKMKPCIRFQINTSKLNKKENVMKTMRFLIFHRNINFTK